jgi:hypothetical protein
MTSNETVILSRLIWYPLSTNARDNKIVFHQNFPSQVSGLTFSGIGICKTGSNHLFLFGANAIFFSTESVHICVLLSFSVGLRKRKTSLNLNKLKNKKDLIVRK